MAAPSFLFLIILAITSSIGSASEISNGGCIPAERAALLSFKAGITSDPANRLVSWRQEHYDCCRWGGVTCSSHTGHVIKLDLRNRSPPGEDFFVGFKDHSLGGQVSSSLLVLRHSLRHLDLSGNVLLGDSVAMPGFLGSLQSLTYLNLSYMGFHGRVPPQLGNLSKLLQLDIGYYEFTPLHSEDLSWLPHLHSLEHLNMAFVNLSRVDDWVQTVSALPNLVVLTLSYCSLNAPLSPLHHNLTVLEDLDLSSNYFNGPVAPNWFWDVTSLKSLCLPHCGLSGAFPDELGNLTLLETFDISYNNIKGMIPGTLQNLCNLKSLALGNNNIGGDITEVINKLPNCSWKNLQELSLMHANITGTTLQFVSNLTSLRMVEFSRNHLSGSVPVEIGMLTNLTYLDLGYNSLTGWIPVEIGMLTNLTFLSLGSNQLRDPVPMEIGMLRNLTFLDLGGNQLSGSVPAEIGKLTNLNRLDMENNHLSGSVPMEIGTLTNLNHLDLRNNDLSGSVPVEIVRLTNLSYLDLRNNKLSGVLSQDHFAGLMNLKYLFLSHNNLELCFHSHWVPPFKLDLADFSSCHLGPQFPKWLQWLNDIGTLDISNTGLVGMIPYWFWTTFSHATSLDISLNQLSGELPLSLEFMSVVALEMQSNLLTGLIPKLPRTTELLDISENYLNGFVENFRAPNLKILILFSNFITGTIPTSICQLRELRVLDLSNNLLSMEVPDCGRKELKEWIPSKKNSLSANSMISSGLKITTLLLRNNNLSSGFPLFLRQCTSLVFLDLAKNRFSGELPGWISEAMPHLVMLSLASNNFSGHIPIEIMELQAVRILDLSNNNFSGAIPRYLRNLKALSGTTTPNYTIFENPFEEVYGDKYGYIDKEMPNDSLSVVIQGELCQYKEYTLHFTSVDLSCNSLTGEIPKELSFLISVTNLNLSSNLLTGNIPTKIGSLQSLEFLDLSKNKLGGQIPQDILDLGFLRYLNLSYNNLSGRIPSGFPLDNLNGDDSASMYIGNPELCGHVIPRQCPDLPRDPSINEEPSTKEDPSTNEAPSRNEDSSSWLEDGLSQIDLLLGSIIGFVVGAWMVFYGLLFMKRWRFAYFGLLDRVYDRLYVISVVTWRKWCGHTGIN